MSRLLRNEILYVICLLPFLESHMFITPGFEAVNDVFRLGKTVTMLICMPLLFLRRKRVSKFFWSAVPIGLITFISSLTSEAADMMICYRFIARILTVFAIGEYFLPILREKLFLITRNLLLIMVLATAYIVIVYPEEITDTATTAETLKLTYLAAFSFGYDNVFVGFTTPLIFMAGMYSLTADRKIDFVLLVSVIISLFITIATWAVGGFLGTIALAAGVIIFSKFKLFNSISSWLFFLTPQITSLMVCVFQIQYYFRDFIENVLEKDVTLSGRTFLWDKVIDLFYKNPLFGIGMPTREKLINIMGFSHAHNEILDHLLRSGLLGLATRFLFWCLLTAKINRIKNGRIRSICNMTFFTQLFISVADTRGDSALFFLCYICMYCYSDVFERNEQPLLLSA